MITLNLKIEKKTPLLNITTTLHVTKHVNKYFKNPATACTFQYWCSHSFATDWNDYV